MSAEAAVLSSSEEVAWLPNGTTFGKYTIVKPLGAGGMGQVYEGVHAALNKRVAIKTLHRAMAALPEVTSRFVQEAEAIAKINHPNVVGVVDTGVEHEMPYIVMEFLEGESLAARIDREHQLPVTDSVEIVLAVIAGVMDAHAEGIIHRDIKPDNVFLTRDRRGRQVPKVVDFGIARLVEEGQARAKTQTSAVIGTVQYLAPELLDGAKNASPASDQYAIGAVLYECLTGHGVIEGESMIEMISSIARSLWKRPAEWRADIPAELDAIIVKTLDAKPSQRFESLLALGESLFAFVSEEGRSVWAADFGRGTVVPPRPSMVDARIGAVEAKPVAPAEIEHAPTIQSPAPKSNRLPLALGALVILALGAVGASQFFKTTTATSTNTTTSENSHAVVPPPSTVIADSGVQTQLVETTDAQTATTPMVEQASAAQADAALEPVANNTRTNTTVVRTTRTTNGNSASRTQTPTTNQGQAQATHSNTGTNPVREGANAAPIIH